MVVFVLIHSDRRFSIRGDQIAKSRLWIARAHQCFADEKTVEPSFAKAMQ